MHRKFLAIFMTVCLVAALFAGCGGKDKGDSSTKPDISSPSTQENGTAADANAVIPGETQHADGQGGTEQTANGSGSNTANTPGGGSNGTTGKKQRFRADYNEKIFRRLRNDYDKALRRRFFRSK